MSSSKIARIINDELKKMELSKLSINLLLKEQISGKQILFTDETKIEMGSFIKDSIRLSQETKEKLKNVENDTFKKINIQKVNLSLLL